MFIELSTGEIINIDLIERVVPKARTLYDLDNRELDVNWLVYIGGEEFPIYDYECRRLMQIILPLKAGALK